MDPKADNKRPPVDESLIEQILDATERDSVIEGLTPFTEAFREELREILREDYRNLEQTKK